MSMRVTHRWIYPDLIAHEADVRLGASPSALYGNHRVQHGAVTLRFDDSQTTDTTIVGPELLSRHLPATFGVIWGRMGTGAPYQDTAAVLALQKQGCEIACHSRNHSDPSAQARPWAFFVDEVETVRAEMVNAGLKVNTWVQPGTWTGRWNFDSQAKLTPEVQRLFAKNYLVATGYIPQRVVGSCYPLPQLARYGVSPVATLDALTLAAAQALVDQAVDNGALVSFTCHSYNIGQSGFMTLADFQTLLTYIQTRRDDGRLDVLTAGAAAHAQRGLPVNLLVDGDFSLSTLGVAPSPVWKATGTPIVVAGRNGGQAVQVGALGTKDVAQTMRADNLGPLFLEGWAKSAVPGAASAARIAFRVRGSANESYDPSDLTKTLPADNSWQRLQTAIGTDSRAATFKIWLGNTTANDAVYTGLVLRGI